MSRPGDHAHQARQREVEGAERVVPQAHQWHERGEDRRLGGAEQQARPPTPPPRATTIRATCGSSARRIARHDPVALRTGRSCRVSGMPRTGHAPANGLQMYYEIHGEEHGGVPVLLLNGAYMTTADFGPLLPGLAASRQVIVVDPQGHGRTADVDRPLTYEGMADDAAALLGHLGVAQADVVGYSMGGCAAIQVGDPASPAGPHAGADLGGLPQRRDASRSCSR
jgi:hypothetical protein